MTDTFDDGRIEDATRAFVDVFRRHVPMDFATAEPFVDVIRRHAHAEFHQDLDATMATVCDHPHFTFEPMGWIIPTRQLLREFYAEAMPVLKNLRPIDDWNPTIFVGEDSVAMWDASLEYCDDAGDITRIYQMAVITRDPATGLIKGENLFVNAEFAAVFEDGLSRDLKARLTHR